MHLKVQKRKNHSAFQSYQQICNVHFKNKKFNGLFVYAHSFEILSACFSFFLRHALLWLHEHKHVIWFMVLNAVFLLHTHTHTIHPLYSNDVHIVTNRQNSLFFSEITTNNLIIYKCKAAKKRAKRKVQRIWTVFEMQCICKKKREKNNNEDWRSAHAHTLTHIVV